MAFKSYYLGSYENYQTDITPLVMLIGSHGSNLTGVEIGVSRSDSLHTLLENTTNISKMYGIDPYLPWKDVDGNVVDGLELDMIRQETLLQLKYSPHKDKIELIEETSEDAVSKFAGESIDFVFIDGDHRYESVYKDLEMWYPKIKKGGLLTGHDYLYEPVKNAVEDFRKSTGIQNHMNVYLSCYAWKK